VCDSSEASHKDSGGCEACRRTTPESKILVLGRKPIILVEMSGFPCILPTDSENIKNNIRIEENSTRALQNIQPSSKSRKTFFDRKSSF